MTSYVVQPGARVRSTRRLALMMSASTGVGGHIPERFRTIIYAVGAPDAAQPQIARLTAYLTARYWELDGTFLDDDGSRPAAGRQGLTKALDRIANGFAVALLMSASDYLAFSPTGRQWLEIEVQRVGGFIQPVELEEGSREVTRAEGLP